MYRLSGTRERQCSKCYKGSRKERKTVTPLVYGNRAPPVWFLTDACLNSIAGVVTQGTDWKSAKVAVFLSTKLNTTQQNYPVHEQEMLTGVEGMLHHQDILQGAKFVWLTDHKRLIHLCNQKNLSGWQVHWLEKISEFDFNIRYIPGMENILLDVLSCLYSNNAPRTMWAPSEYVQFADKGVDEALHNLISMPVLVGTEAGNDVAPLWRSCRPNKGIPRERLDPTPEPRPLTNQGKQGVAREPGLQPSLALAESGRPEPATKFAHWMHDRFVLCRPRERTEGGMTEETPHNHPEIQPKAVESTNKSVNDERHKNVLLTFLDNNDLMSKIKGQYVQDSFFKLILEAPECYRNFKVMDSYVRLQTKDRAACVSQGSW